MSGYVVLWARESNTALDDVSRATTLSNAYRDALQAISDSQVTVINFMEDPSPEHRVEFEANVSRAAAALEYISSHGEADDQALVQQIIATYAPHLPEIIAVLDFAGAGTPAEAAFPPEQLIDELRLLLAGPEAASRAEATERLQVFQSAQERQSTIVAAGLLLGLPILAGLVFVIRVLERREMISTVNLQRLEEAAHTDSLTGLGNHRAFQEELQREVDVALAAGARLSLAVIDVDQFKEVNDTAGHARGDQILIQLGRLLRETCVAEDRLFRVGGDEFAVIMPGCGSEDARQRMERIRTLAGLTGATISSGVAELEPADDTEILREKADSTLYLAKRRGRNAVLSYSSEEPEQRVVTQSRIAALRDIIRTNRIDIAFQSVHHSSGAVIGYEALARIPAGYELDGPQEAFDIAERVGRSHELDILCLREALRLAKPLPAEEVLFLNISPRTLEHAAFSAASIARLVLDAGLQPGQICLEITERSAAPIKVIQQATEALRVHGFRIALDDVGAGNSGLEMMRHLKVDYVKIDQSVMLGALERGPGRAVLLAIIVFAAEAGAFVIAEGIETPEMLAVIRETNDGPFTVQGVQGYILGQPGSAIASRPLPLSA